MSVVVAVVAVVVVAVCRAVYSHRAARTRGWCKCAVPCVLGLLLVVCAVALLGSSVLKCLASLWSCRRVRRRSFRLACRCALAHRERYFVRVLKCGALSPPSPWGSPALPLGGWAERAGRGVV